MISKDLKQKIDALSYRNQDEVYRYLWSKHVREDVIAHTEDMGINLTNEDIASVVRSYVYDGDYDCNLDYWSNIENIIKNVTGQ